MVDGVLRNLTLFISSTVIANCVFNGPFRLATWLLSGVITFLFKTSVEEANKLGNGGGGGGKQLIDVVFITEPGTKDFSFSKSENT